MRSRLNDFFNTSFAALLSAVLQLISFIIIGRSLGADSYAVILAGAMYVVIFVEFVGPGVGDFTIKSLNASDVSADKLISDSFLSIILTYPVVLFFVYFLLSAIYPSLFNLIFFVFAAELLSTKLVSYFDHFNIAIKNILIVNYFKISHSFFKCLIVLTYFVFYDGKSIESWVVLHVITSIVISASIVVFFYKRFSFVVSSGFNFYRFLDGIRFGFSQLLRALGGVTDRYVVDVFFSKTDFSIYSVAYRFVQFSLIPLQSVQKLAYPGFFSSAKLSVSHCYSYSVKRFFPSLMAASLSTLGLLIASTFIELLLGSTFLGVSDIFIVFSALPILIAVNNVCQDFFVAVGKFKVRYFSQFLLISLLVFGYFVSPNTDVFSYSVVVVAVYFVNSILSFLLMAYIHVKGLKNESRVI